MLGAIIGDLAGSIYEFDQYKKVIPISMNKIIEDDAFFSDDTILTVAVADAILNKKDYEDNLKQYINKYNNKLPKHKPYFKTMFSDGTAKWAQGEYRGKSYGNGAMMRVSPVGYLFNSEQEVIKNAYLTTVPSHDTEEAIISARLIALIIYYAKNKKTKQEIINKLNLKIKKPNITKFNYSCKDTIDVCLYSLFKSNSFIDSIKLAISFGGDTDTNACIVGSMAEAMYGISEQLKKQALSKLPKEFVKIINQFYKKVQ